VSSSPQLVADEGQAGRTTTTTTTTTGTGQQLHWTPTSCVLLNVLLDRIVASRHQRQNPTTTIRFGAARQLRVAVTTNKLNSNVYDTRARNLRRKPVPENPLTPEKNRYQIACQTDASDTGTGFLVPVLSPISGNCVVGIKTVCSDGHPKATVENTDRRPRDRPQEMSGQSSHFTSYID